MRLGTQTASLVNHMYSRMVVGEPTPYVGMGVTILHWTDRDPATIVEVVNDKHIVIQDDEYRRIDNNGLSESQEYDYFPNPAGYKRIFKKDRKGLWAEYRLNPETNRLNKSGGAGLRIGEREKYYDFSF